MFVVELRIEVSLVSDEINPNKYLHAVGRKKRQLSKTNTKPQIIHADGTNGSGFGVTLSDLQQRALSEEY